MLTAWLTAEELLVSILDDLEAVDIHLTRVVVHGFPNVFHRFWIKFGATDPTVHLFQWLISRKVEEPLSVWRFREDLWWVITEADEHVLSKPPPNSAGNSCRTVGIDLNILRSEWTFARRVYGRNLESRMGLQ
jgi:hypothetical protein